MYKQKKFTLKGMAPLLMHNGYLANPKNPIAKEIAKINSKKKKTDEDVETRLELEWMGGLYVNDKSQIVIPGEVVEGVLVEGAKKNKLGKLFKAGMYCADSWVLHIPGNKNAGREDIEKLKDDPNYRLECVARIGTSKIVRCRPMFTEWKLEFVINYLPNVINLSDIEEAMVIAGRIVGMGDWRPKYGRFEVL